MKRIWGPRRKAAPPIENWLNPEWLMARVLTCDTEIDRLCIRRERSVELMAALLAITEDDAEVLVIDMKRALDARDMECEVLSDIAALPGDET